MRAMPHDDQGGRLTCKGPDGYLRLASRPNLVDTEEALRDLQRRAEFGGVVLTAIDAEWPPCERSSRGQTPATLVQLAWRDGEGRDSVDVVDLVALRDAGFANLLIGVLDGLLIGPETILKVGYGAAQDARAVCKALGLGIDWNVKRKDWFDLSMAHRLVGGGRGSALGLADMTSTALGCPIDKALQCSAWGDRPLQQAQVEYAALDSACLIDIFDVLVRRRVISQVQPAAGDGKLGVGGDGEQPEPRTDCLACGHKLRALLKKERKRDRREPRARRRGGVRAAGKGGRAAGASAACDDGDGAEGEASQQPSDGTPLWVALGIHAEWLMGDRTAARPKFVVDEMLEGLARQLRSCGIDAKSIVSAAEATRLYNAGKQEKEAKEGKQGKQGKQGKEGVNGVETEGGGPSDPTARRVRDQKARRESRQMTYRKLVECSELEDRVILTADEKLRRRGLTDRGVFLVNHQANRRDQLRCVLESFSIDVASMRELLFSRCILCNGVFERLLDTTGLRKELVDKHKDNLFHCTTCKQGACCDAIAAYARPFLSFHAPLT